MEKLLISIIVFCLGIGFIAQVEKCNYPIPKQELLPVQQVKQNIANFESKTGSKFKTMMYDYRSSEPTYRELKEFIIQYPDVDIIIRLNGEDKDSDGLSIEREKKLVQSLGRDFKYIPMTNDYKKWAESIMPIMLKNNVLVHCHHGHDRTGFVFAYKLIKYHGYSFDQVRKMNGWDKYDKYSKKFYPILRELDKKY